MYQVPCTDAETLTAVISDVSNKNEFDFQEIARPML